MWCSREWEEVDRKNIERTEEGSSYTYFISNIMQKRIYKYLQFVYFLHFRRKFLRNSIG